MLRGLSLVIAVGCSGSEPELVRVDVPLAEDHQAVILAVDVRDGDRSELLVSAAQIDGRTITPFTQDFPLAGQVSVTALLYDQTLEVPSGLLERERRVDLARDIPRADLITRTDVTAGEASEWVDQPVLPPELEQYAITAPDRCGRFEANVISLGDTGTPTFVLALDERWTLVGINKRLIADPPHLLMVDADGAVREVESPSSMFSAFRQEDGTLWLGGERGVVYRGTYDGDTVSLVASSTVVSREDITDIVGAPTGSELFAMTSNRGTDEIWGAFEWFDGVRWTVPGLRRNTPHDATWMEPGYGLFASFWRDGLVFGARDGVEVDITVSSIVFGSIIEIENMPGFGLVGGSSAGEIHFKPEGGQDWELAAAVNTEPINGLHRYEQGLVFLSGDNMVRYLREPEPTVCRENVIIERGLRFGRDVTVIGPDVVVPLENDQLGEDQLGEQHVAWFKRLF